MTNATQSAFHEMHLFDKSMISLYVLIFLNHHLFSNCKFSKQSPVAHLLLLEFDSNYVPLNGSVVNSVERVDNQLFAYTTDGQKHVSKILEIEEAYNMVNEMKNCIKS